MGERERRDRTTELELTGVHDRYEIERFIGRGGMGAVYLAKQLDLERRVVIKVIAGGHADDATIVERFRREALTAARIDSDNVVKVYETGRLSGLPFIAMEWVDGASAAQLLTAHGRLDHFSAAEIVLGTARALEKAHKVGIVHRDVKPANILVAKDGRVKLSDFGLAKVIDAEAHGGEPLPEMTAPGTTVGTAAYVSPEQAQCLEMDGRSDVYSLGITFFELMTGKVPFAFPTQLEVLAARVTTDAPSPRSLVAEIPASYAEVCLALLARSVSARPTMEQAKSLLKQLVAAHPTRGLATLFKPPGFNPPGFKPPGFNPPGFEPPR